MEILNVFDSNHPIVKMAGSKRSDNEDTSQTRKYFKIVLNVLNYICKNNTDLLNNIKNKLLDFWNINPNIIELYNQCNFNRSSKYNSAVAFQFFGFSYLKMNLFNNWFDYFYKFKPFSSQGNITYIFNSFLPVWDRFLNFQNRFNKSQINKKGSSIAKVYCLGLLLGMGMNATGWINNNIFQINQMTSPYLDQISVFCSSDKCTIDQIGCYLINVGVKGGIGSSSASHVTTTLVIFGKFKDDAKSLTQLYNITNYTNEMSALNRYPALVTFVKYIEKENNLKHRYTNSCVLAFCEEYHTQLNLKIDQTENESKWKENHPDKRIEHPEDDSFEKSSVFEGWIGQRRGRMGVRDIQPRRAPRDKAEHNWLKAVSKYLKHLKEDTPKKEWISVKGFNFVNDNNNNNSNNGNDIYENEATKTINEWAKRGLGDSFEECKLPYVNEIKFGDGLYLFFVSFVVC